MWATLQDWVQSVEILLEANATVESIDRFGYTVLMLARYLNHSQVGRILQLAGAANTGVEKVELIHAIENREKARGESLLKAAVRPNAVNPQGDSALKLAIKTEQLEICRLLIQAGAELGFVDNDRRESALLTAVRQGQREILRVLIEAEAPVNLQGADWGETALIEAVRYCDLEAVLLLLKANADINIRDCFGCTALDYTEIKNCYFSLNDQTEIGILLLDAGAKYGSELIEK